MDDDQMGQDEIEALLRKAQSGDLGDAPEAKEEEDLESLGQNDIEALFQGAEQSPSPKPKARREPTAPAAATAQAAPQSSGGAGDDLSLLLDQAEAALASLDNPNDNLPSGISPFQLRDFGGSPANTESATIDLVRDVELDVKIELGKAEMNLQEVLQMKKGSVVPLDKLAGDPVDIYVNGRLIARGEVLILNDNFCVRLTELVAGDSVE